MDRFNFLHFIQALSSITNYFDYPLEIRSPSQSFTSIPLDNFKQKFDNNLLFGMILIWLASL